MNDTSVYARKGSPKWYVSYWCAKRLKRVHEATPWRTDDPTGRKHAMRFAAAKATEAAAFRGHAKLETWGTWVVRFLEDRYRNSPKTLTRYKNAWDWLLVFLEENQVALPAGFTYNHAIGYLDWRVLQKRHCKKPISRNTAITELKTMGLIMREAIRRGFATINPCERMNIQRDPAREKPELSADEIATIRKACALREGHLPIAEQWMTTSFEIALHTLCRLSSTQVPLEMIDFANKEISLRVKGRRNGEPKYLSVPIHPDLLPRLVALRDAHAAFTCVLPKMASKHWWALRQELQIGHTCFHSTRVTGITRLMREGVPETVTMRLAGHGSPTVHRIYQRQRTGDLAKYLGQLTYQPRPAPAAGTDATPQTPGAPAASA